MQFVAGRDVELELDLQVGELELPWPEDLDDEPRLRHRIELFGPAERPVCSFSTTTEGGALGGQPGSLALLEEPRRWLLAGVPPGEYRLEWSVEDPEQRTRIDLPNGGWRLQSEVVHRHEANVTVRP